MQTDVEVLILPYSSADGSSLLDRLISELRSGSWTEFRCAVAFARTSGNFPALLEALEAFVDQDPHRAALTFGADVFGTRGRGSDYEAIRHLLERFEGRPNVAVHLYHERGRTFHPKIYLFANEDEQRALVIIGSSNWSEGGLVQNVEANTLLRLDLTDADHRAFWNRLSEHFDRYWSETDE